jgi:hypothetical protein
MELKEQIVLEIDKIPESYLEEVYDFLKFLTGRGSNFMSNYEQRCKG